jgi:hypothetical protein
MKNQQNYHKKQKTAIKNLNIIYDQTALAKKYPFPLENIKIQLLGEELNFDLIYNKIFL